MTTAWIALLCVYFFWGTTYLGIRIALESMPPLFLVAARYLLSGTLLLIAARWKGAHIPATGSREFRLTALFGLLTLGIGNTALAIAEQWTPAGLASLFSVTSPFWMIGLDAAIPGGERFRPRVLWGVLICLCGVGILLAPGATAISSGAVLGFFVIQAGNVGWSSGSILQRRLATQANPIVSGAIQQLATGLFFTIPAALTTDFEKLHITGRGWMAIAYLATFGSIVGYSAYLYALEKLPVAIVSTYTYVNPVVACVFGWLLLNEPFGVREAAAMAVIFAGVAVLRRMQRSVS